MCTCSRVPYPPPPPPPPTPTSSQASKPNPKQAQDEAEASQRERQRQEREAARREERRQREALLQLARSDQALHLPVVAMLSITLLRGLPSPFPEDSRVDEAAGAAAGGARGGKGKAGGKGDKGDKGASAAVTGNAVTTVVEDVASGIAVETTVKYDYFLQYRTTDLEGWVVTDTAPYAGARMELGMQNEFIFQPSRAWRDLLAAGLDLLLMQQETTTVTTSRLGEAKKKDKDKDAKAAALGDGPPPVVRESVTKTLLGTAHFDASALFVPSPSLCTFDSTQELVVVPHTAAAAFEWDPMLQRRPPGPPRQALPVAPPPPAPAPAPAAAAAAAAAGAGAPVTGSRLAVPSRGGGGGASPAPTCPPTANERKEPMTVTVRLTLNAAAPV